MLGNLFTVAVHLHGTLAANAAGRFSLPVAATLKEVQASAGNDSAATLDFGTAADPNGYLAAVTIGDSEAVSIYGNSEWNGALYTDADNIENIHIPEDTVLEWTLDFDGAAGTAAQNVSIHFVFVA